MVMGAFGRKGCGTTSLMVQSCLYLAGRGRLIFAYDPMHQFPDANRYDFEGFEDVETVPSLVAFSDCEPDDVAQLALSTGDCIFACDEADLLCSPNVWYSEAARNIARRGRHYRVGMILTGLRFANVHRDIAALADVLALFHTEDEEDVRRIERRVGRVYADHVTGLSQGEFLAHPFRQLARLGLDGAEAQARPLP